MPDDVVAGGLGESAAGGIAAVDQASNAGTESSGNAGQADDYSDLAGDPRVQKYVSDLHSKALKDIPKEYRDSQKFQGLLASQKRLQELEGNPHVRSFLAGQGAQQGQGQQQQAQKAASFLQAITEKGLHKRHNLGEPVVNMLGEYGDLMAEHLLSQVESKYFKPIQEHLGRQAVESEWAEASKLPGFQESLPAIQQVMERYGHNIGWADAYKLAKFDDLQKAQAAAQQAAEGVGEEDDGRLRRAKASEKPTGHGSADVSLKKAKSRGDSKANAERRLAAVGLNVRSE